MTEKERRLFLLVVISLFVLSMLVLFTQPANAEEPESWTSEPVLITDGHVFYPSKISGPTVHFETPFPNPA